MLFTENRIKIKRFTFNPFAENTYIVWDSENKDAVIIDPGMSTVYEEEELSQYIQYNNLIPAACINTHCHLDHIWGNAYIKQFYGIPLIAPKLDMPMYYAAPKQAASFGFEMPVQPEPDELLDAEQTLNYGAISLRSLFTPGHAPGEYSFEVVNTKFILVGDVIFEEGIGRTDLWGGDLKTLISSINSKIMTYPDYRLLLSGHGAETTVGHERGFNPYL